MARYTMTLLGTRCSQQFSTAPNGSSRGTDYYTTTYEVQDWHDVPENGIYAGRSYLITCSYISQSPSTRGQALPASSRPYHPNLLPEDMVKAV